MNSKRTFVLVLTAGLIFVATNALALKQASFHSPSDADEQWAPLGGGPIGQDWSNPENWYHNIVPTVDQKAKINRSPGPVISSEVEVYQIFVSEGNMGAYEYAPCTLRVVDGAVVNVGQTSIFGYYTDDNGTLQIDGGVVDITQHLFIGRKGTGALVMNDGVLTVGGNFAVSRGGGNGYVELNGGRLYLNQLSYEYAFDPDYPETPLPDGPGQASINLAGGVIYHNSEAIPGVYQEMIEAGKLIAYGGKGSVIVRYDSDAGQTIVKGQITLWDYPDISIIDSSTVIDESVTGLDRMFRPRLVGSDAAMFLDDPAGAGAVYFVEWETGEEVTVHSVELTAEHDNEEGDPPFGRTVRHFTLKAQSAGSATYDVILFDGEIDYQDSIVDLIIDLSAPVTAKAFRAEFVGDDVRGVRIRRLNAAGDRTLDQRWNIADLIVTPETSSVINDPGQPGAFDIANMFENRWLDNLSTIFEDGDGLDHVYTVVFRPIKPAEIRSIELVAEHDGDGNNYQRAIKHFTLKAKSIGSDDYDRILYDGPVSVPYPDNILRLAIDLATPVTAYEYRAEFTGNDTLGVRVRELNAIGTATGIQPLWNPDDIVIGNRTPFQIDTRLHDVDNMFQETGKPVPARHGSTIFEDFSTDTVYYVEWKTNSYVSLNAFHLLATHDAVDSPTTPMQRAMKRVVLKTKSPGSSTYDLTLYDGNVSLPYNAAYSQNVLDLWVNMESPVVAREFRAEFTGNDSMGLRIGELDAIGTVLAELPGDLDGDGAVDLADFVLLANEWGLDNSDSVSTQTLETFESYATIPNATWANWLGQTSSSYNNLYLETSVVKTGSKAIRWTYDLDPGVMTGDDVSGIVYMLPSPINLRDYGTMRVWVHRAAGNSLENHLGVKFMWAEPGSTAQPHASKVQAEALILSADGSTQTPSGVWDEWVIDFRNDLVFKNPTTRSIDDIYDVGSMIFYVANRLSFTGGPGTLRLDDIRLATNCLGPDADLNGDCVVDIEDLAIIVSHWLEGK